MTDKIYRPDWIEPKKMKEIGYDLISDKGGYLKYENEHGLEVPGYGKMWKGKRIVYVNTTYVHFSDVKDIVYVGIEEDGGTRKVYGGVVDSGDFLQKLLTSVR